MKIEVEDGEDVEMSGHVVVPPSNETSKEERAAALRAQIKALEEEMKASESIPIQLLGFENKKCISTLHIRAKQSCWGWERVG